MPAAAIYCRVSTRQQAEDGSSLDSQEAACRKLALAQGFSDLQVFKEDFPGSELQRPMLDELRAGIKHGSYQAIFCYATDRLSRSPVHLALIAEECQKAGVSLFFVSEPLDNSPEGQLLTFVRGWAAQLEREKIKDRTIRGKQSRMKEGKLPQGTGRTGSAFGYSYNRVTGKREIREEEALVIADIFHLCDSGISPHRIAVILNQRGITSPMGYLWDPRTVRFLLRNEIYAGKTWSGRTKRVHLGGKRVAYERRPVSEWVEIKEATPPIITPELFTRVQERLSRPFRQVGRIGVKYLLQGFVNCTCGGSICGATMTGGHATGPFFYYRCLNTKPRPARPRSCDARNIRMNILDDAVWQEVAKVILNPEVIIAELRRRQGAPTAILEEIGKHERVLKSLEKQKQRVVRLYRFGELDDDTIEKEIRKINRLTADAEATIRELNSRSKIASDFEPIAQRATRYCGQIADKLKAFDFDQRRELMQTLQLEVTVSPTRIVSIFCTIPAEEEDRYVTLRHASACMFQDQGIELLASILHAA